MERTKQEALLIENEQWSSTEVPQDFQDIIGRISAVAGAKDNSKKFMTETFFPAVDGSVAKSSGVVKNQSEPTKFLHIGDQSYFVVGCSLLIIKMMEDYIKCMIRLDGMTVDIMQKMIELLKVCPVQQIVLQEKDLVVADICLCIAVQFKSLSSHSRCWCHAISWTQKYFGKASW